MAIDFKSIVKWQEQKIGRIEQEKNVLEQENKQLWLKLGNCLNSRLKEQEKK